MRKNYGNCNVCVCWHNEERKKKASTFIEAKIITYQAGYLLILLLQLTWKLIIKAGKKKQEKKPTASKP